MTATGAQATRTLPGSRFPLGATVTATGTNFAVASDVADGMLLCLFDEEGTETQIPIQDSDAGVWNVLRARRRAWPGLRIPGHWPVRPGQRRALSSGQAPARPVRAGGERDGHVRARGARLLRGRPGRAERGRLRALRPAEHRGRGRALRLARRRPPRPHVRGNDHLRDARQELHHAPSRGAAGVARHVCRPGQTSPSPT